MKILLKTKKTELNLSRKFLSKLTDNTLYFTCPKKENKIGKIMTHRFTHHTQLGSTWAMTHLKKNDDSHQETNVDLLILLILV
jgi:hypothetical protein